MPYLNYRKPKRFGAEASYVIRQANVILDEYARQGYTLTLRQLYYQFVARDLIPNSDRSYKRLGSIISDARMSGDIDWEAIIDRTRNLRGLVHFDNPADALRVLKAQYRLDRWPTQPTYVEVWIEKDALVGVIENPCRQLDVPFFSCRGYTSQSELWAASQRVYKKMSEGQGAVILHLGDHDPSGIDMSRDIRERMETFLTWDYARESGITDVAEIRHEFTRGFRLDRIALNMDQVEQYDPPPNPAKLTDSRVGPYVAEFGESSWELDALEPTVIGNLIRDAVEELQDPEAWHEVQLQETQDLERFDALIEQLS